MSIKMMQIDDDFINNMANERLLRKMGLEFESRNFLDPIEALAYVESEKEECDFLLLDINMPGINGWEFLERFRPLNKKYPVFMLTTSVDPLDESKAKNHQSLTGFYVKPLTKEMMAKILQVVYPNKLKDE